MAVRGRRPKPMALKILEGERADRMNFNEPRLPAGSLEPPSWLGGYALEHWIEMAPILSTAGMLTSGDRAALAQMCDDYETIRRSIDGPEVLEEAAADNWRNARTMLSNADKARDRYRRMLTEFGLTPSSRSRIRSTLEPPKNKLSSFIDARKEKKA